MKTKNITPLQRHKGHLCDCTDTAVELKHKRCIYRSFCDNWNFVPQVSENAKTRGEVFTPSWTVEYMIDLLDAIPEEALYHGDYTTLTEKQIEKLLKAYWIEPAVGTGNFTATILYHRLRYAYQASLISNPDGITPNKVLDLPTYHMWVLTVVGNTFAYDIDCGNLEISKRRLLSHGKEPLNIPSKDGMYDPSSFWRSYLLRELTKNSTGAGLLRKRPPKLNFAKVDCTVQASLNEAQKHWHRFIRKGIGIIDHAYLEATSTNVGVTDRKTHKQVPLNGHRIPDFLYWQLREILDKNILLFNGMVEKDIVLSSDDQTPMDVFLPGFGRMQWTFWKFIKQENQSATQLPLVKENRISHKKIFLFGKLKSYMSRIYYWEKEHKKLTLLDDGLFSVEQSMWDSKENEKTYSSLLKEAEAVAQEIKKLYNPYQII